MTEIDGGGFAGEIKGRGGERGVLTTGSLIKTSFLKMGTLDMKSMTAPAPAPPHMARVGTHLKVAPRVLSNLRRREGGDGGRKRRGSD